MTLPEKRVLLIFCEGDHDLVLIRMILRKHLVFNEEKWLFSEFPAPFNSFFPTRMKAHAANDLALGLVHEFFLPNYVLSKADQLVLLFRTGGENKISMMKEFLGDLAKLQRASMFPNAGAKSANAMTKSMSYLFVYDADDKGPEKIRARAVADFQKVGDQDWLKTPWQVEQNDPLAATSDNKAIYVWSANGKDGTLEDLVYPAFEKDQADLINKAASASTQVFGDAKLGITNQAKRKKVNMTIAGQGKKPGHGLHLILKEGELIKVETLLEIPAIKQFSQFLAGLL
jgi:hypothetical protein